MIYINKKVFTFIMLLIMILGSVNSYADKIDEENSNHKKVYIIIANKLTLEDIEHMDNLKSLIIQGSLGLMNTRGINGTNTSEGFLSINSSSRAYGRFNYSRAFNLNEKKISLYKTRVGHIDYGEYQVGNLEINRIIKENSEKSYNTKIGVLGDSIHSANLKTAIFGNSDTDETPIRIGSLVIMDSRGLIDYGNVDDILIEDQSYPYGIRTDYDKTLRGISEVKEKASLILIDTGDLNRLASYNNNLNDEMFKYHRKNILTGIDSFIKDLMQIADDNSMLMVVSPNIETERISTSKLSPIIIWSNKGEQGVLTSTTTRREGIVSNLDIAPTVANFLDTPTNEFIGHNIESKKSQNNMDFIKSLDITTNLVSNLRSPVLTRYNTFTIIVILLSLIVLLLNLKNNKRVVKIIENKVFIILSVPIVLMVLPVFNINSRYIYMLIGLLVIISIILLLNLFNKKDKMWILISLNLIIIVLDILLGNELIKTSIIGYDPIIGARYFGIGNELVGVLLPSMIFTVVYGLNKFKNKFALILLPICTIVVGHPNLGANVGGTISVLFSTIIFILLLSGVKINFKRLILIILGVLISIFTIGLLDALVNPNPTHLGQTFIMVKQKGISFIVNIIVRKMQVNIRLMKVSTWAKVLFTSLLFINIIFLLYKDYIIKILKENKYLDIGLISLISGSIVGFLLNDSGLLIAAIASKFMVAILIYNIIVDKKLGNSS